MYEIIVGDIIPSEILGALSEDMVYGIVGDIAEGARNEWIRLAGETLQTSRNDYVNSIQAVVHKPNGVAILSLVGQPANIIEHGHKESIDLRDWLLGSRVPEAPPGQPGKRRAKDGHFYRSIPFRHGTPGTSGAVGVAMGDAYAKVVKDSAALGRAVYASAKKLGPAERLPIHMQYGRGKKLSIPLLRDEHKTNIYAGMTKLRGAYKSAKQSQYVTYRTISQANPAGWMLSPSTGIDLASKVQDYIERVAPQAFAAYVAQIGGA